MQTSKPKDLSKISRNNKNRGRNFENLVAKTLKWTRVPGSGSGPWGRGDVVDGFYAKHGKWACECKTQQPGPKSSISIKEKYIDQMYKAVEDTERYPMIAVRNVGSTESWVFLPQQSYDYLRGMMQNRIGSDTSFELRPIGKGRGFVVDDELLPPVGDIAQLVVADKAYDEASIWYVLNLSDFAAWVHESGAMVYEPER